MKSIEEKANKMGLIKYPVNYQDEPYSHAHCQKQYDVNKQERDAFVYGYLTVFCMLKDNLSIDTDCNYETDYGKVYTNIKVSLSFDGIEISNSNISI